MRFPVRLLPPALVALATGLLLAGCVVVAPRGHAGRAWVPGYWASPHVWVQGHWRYH
ncbi:hypothetical protein [Frateuria defendens]|uniref:hypothetical protein n=1 Tax=Frateuria defendens TaxID=2219559 RepID=UPI001292FCFC|nr:hypothetical protein [Frateuria defendens]